MTKPALIQTTKTFASDGDGMPVSRQLAAAEQQTEPRQTLKIAEPASEAQSDAWLAATGVAKVDDAAPATVADAYLAQTGAAAPEKRPAPAESADPFGDAWAAATNAGFPA